MTTCTDIVYLNSFKVSMYTSIKYVMSLWSNKFTLKSYFVFLSALSHLNFESGSCCADENNSTMYFSGVTKLFQGNFLDEP